jgi:DNA-binding NarL/FixJ family response regulator
VLADDNVIVRNGVQRILELEGDGALEVVGVADSLSSLLATVEQTTPDVVLTDIRMPPTKTDEGIRAADELRVTHPGTAVVVLSQYTDGGLLLRLIEGGSSRRGYLLKERVSHEGDVVSVLQTVAAGGSYVDPLVIEALATHRARSSSPLARLTDRERQTLCEMAAGKSNAAIARALYVGDRAIEKYINSIFAKLGLMDDPDDNRRVKAVIMFLAEAADDRAGSE